MPKIKVQQPIVDLDGDEMTRVMWRWIKDLLILPYLDVEIKYFDLGIENRDKTDDKITLDAAAAIKQYGVGIKCATITPDEARVKEFSLRRMYPSPNGTIRNALDGTIFREPIICNNIKPLVRAWHRPIVVARHAFADQYRATELLVPGAGDLTLTFTPKNGGTVTTQLVKTFDSAGVALAMFNVDASIYQFARACFHYARDKNYPLYFATKNTVLKKYDGRFKDIFAEVYEKEFKKEFEQRGIFYDHRLIDDMVAQSLRGDGGY
ncbi:MAG: NADP-dependent isocitrate dehydrogenase, partial [Alphaproteobacteria bacterium]|nr:NADP-dependent isocitrate dehydrogenase [Alphaproteobacteria bacterium]